jgi:outer membrane protein TolC
MTKKSVIAVLFCIIATPSYSQSVTLEQLIDAALQHHSYTNKLASEDQLRSIKADGIRANLLPDISVNAFVGYQSLVPEFPLQMPGIPSPSFPKDRYQASLDINQMIYDGGLTRQREKLLEIETFMARTRIMADRFPIQQQVVDAWFGLELVAVQRSILKLTLEDLEARHRMLEVGLEEGIVMQMDVDRIAVELARVRQKDAQIHDDSLRIADVLSEITGLSFSRQTIFVVSNTESSNDLVLRIRPETILFELAADKVEASVELEKSQRRPRVSGYLQGAYGKPGLDIFADTFSPFWQAGLRASWVLWDKGSAKRDQEISRILKHQIDDDRAFFDRNISIAIRNQEAEIEKNRELLDGDQQIITLHQRIKRASEAKLDEGIINATDYLTDVRAVEQARLQYESRKIAIRYANSQIQILRGGL